MYTELHRIKATQRYLDGEGLSLCQNKYRVLFFPMISGKCVAIILLMEIYFFFLCLKYLVNLGVWGKPPIMKTFPGQRFSCSPGGRRWLHTAALCIILLHITAYYSITLLITEQYCTLLQNMSKILDKTEHNCTSLHITAHKCTPLHTT